MSGSNLRQSLYFKKEFLDRSAEFVLLFGIDEYLDMQDQQLEEELEISDDWKCVKYFIRQPNNMLAGTNLGWIQEDYEFARGNKSQEVEDHIWCLSGYHWDLREQEALVDLYKTTQQSRHQKVEFNPIVDTAQSSTKLVSWIGWLNSSWEEEGLWVRSLIVYETSLVLILLLGNFKFRLVVQAMPPSKQSFVFYLKSSVLSRMLSIGQSEKGVDLKIDQDIISKYQRLNIYQQICLVYELNKELGLSVSYEQAVNTISDILVVKASKYSYRSAITHIVKKCSQQIEDPLLHQELINMLESSEEQNQKLFGRIYEKSRSKLMSN